MVVAGSTLTILVTAGVVVDRLMILGLKRERFVAAEHRRMAEAEAQALAEAWSRAGLPDYANIDGTRGLVRSNAELWRLENEVREHERAQRFDAAFFDAVTSIQRMNRMRADHRRVVCAAIARECGVELIEIPVGADTLADRIAIEEVAARMTGASPPRAAELLRRVWLVGGLPDIFTGGPFEGLRLANTRLWRIKDVLDGTVRPTPSAFGAVCRSMYLVNDARAHYKSLVADHTASEIRDVKEYSWYPMPSGWDARGLEWIRTGGGGDAG